MRKNNASDNLSYSFFFLHKRGAGSLIWNCGILCTRIVLFLTKIFMSYDILWSCYGKNEIPLFCENKTIIIIYEKCFYKCQFIYWKILKETTTYWFVNEVFLLPSHPISGNLATKFKIFILQYIKRTRLWKKEEDRERKNE